MTKNKVYKTMSDSQENSKIMNCTVLNTILNYLTCYVYTIYLQ